MITNPNNPCYVETDSLKKTVEFFQDDVLDEGIQNHPRLFGALCLIYSNYLNSSKDKSAFTVWLEDTSSSGFKSYNGSKFQAKVNNCD